MKKLLVACGLLLAMAGSAFAQEEVNLLSTRATALTRQYLRPSLTRIYLVDGSANAQTAVKAIQEVDEENQKFDKNRIQDFVYNVGSTPTNKAERDSVVKAFAEKVIAEKKIGSQVMKNYFPEFKDGGYTVDRLFERGAFAATDNDVLRSNASARQSLMSELGENLIDRSYVIFYLIKDDKTANSKPDSKGKYPTYVDVVPYVYKMNFNEEVRNNFYSNFFDKENGIDLCDFPLSFITNAKSGVHTEADSYDDEDDEKLFTILRKVSDFQAKSPVVETNPVRAKIGLKEGVRCDKRYVAMENRLDKDGNKYAKRIATLRATNHIADNYAVATGAQEDLTSFYYIKGRRVKEGMTIVENPDFGITVGAAYTLADISLSVDYRIGQYFGVTGMYAGLKFGVANDEKGGIMQVYGVTDKDGKQGSIPVLKLGLYVGKEFNFARSFAFTPVIGAGVLWPVGAKKLNISGQNATYDPDKMSIDSYYLEGAVRAGYYVTRNIQLYAEAGYTLNIMGKEFKFMRDLKAQQKGWSEARDPMSIRFGAGVRVGF